MREEIEAKVVFGGEEGARVWRRVGGEGAEEEETLIDLFRFRSCQRYPLPLKIQSFLAAIGFCDPPP